MWWGVVSIWGRSWWWWWGVRTPDLDSWSVRGGSDDGEAKKWSSPSLWTIGWNEAKKNVAPEKKSSGAFVEEGGGISLGVGGGAGLCSPFSGGGSRRNSRNEPSLENGPTPWGCWLENPPFEKSLVRFSSPNNLAFHCFENENTELDF